MTRKSTKGKVVRTAAVLSSKVSPIRIQDVDLDTMSRVTGWNSRQIEEAFRVVLTGDLAAGRDIEVLVGKKDPDPAFKALQSRRYPEGGPHWNARIRRVAKFFRR